MSQPSTDHGAATAAATLNITPRHLSRLAAEQHLSKTAHGKYPFPAYVHEFINYVEHGKVADSVAEVERRLKEEQTRKLRIHNDHQDGVLVKRAAIEQGAALAQTELNAELDGLPGRLCVELAAQTDAAIVRHRIREEIIDVRNNYAARLSRLIDSVTARGTEAEVQDASAVGKRKPRAPARKRGTRKVPK